MQVILLEKVANLGVLGDVVKVKDGYARNYLIPQGFAKRATKQNLAEFEVRRAEFEKMQADKLSAAQSLAEKVAGLMLQITRKAGVDGRLFGSVTNIDVVEALTEQGFNIERSAVRMPQGPIKQISDNDIEIALHTDIIVTVKVSVLGEHN